MSILWSIRLIMMAFLFILITIFAYFLKNREKYSDILENTNINLISVILFNALCYLSMIIPSDENVITRPPLFDSALNLRWFDILGLIIIIFGVLIMLRTIFMRKAVGAQDTAGKLLTKGIYSFCRHPIYFGIIMVSFGLGLRSINVDGLIIFPFILLANFIQAKLEEVYDVGVRFKEEYLEYKRKTKIFGPIWFWLVLLIFLILPLIISILNP